MFNTDFMIRADNRPFKETPDILKESAMGSALES